MQKAKGDAVLVSEQSGIHTGTGGLNIDVSGQTSLVGGLITSQPTTDKNSFSTGTLTVADIDTHSTWKAETYGGGIGTSGLTIAPPVKAGENETGKAYSAIGGNIGITITDPAHQVQDIGTIRRDTENTNTSLPGLPDLQNILRQQYKNQADFQAAQATMAELVGDIAGNLRDNDKTAEEHAFWDEGGAGRALLHAVGAGILGGVNGWEGALKGAAGAATSVLLTPAIADLVKGMLKDSTLSDQDKQTLASLLGESLSALAAGAVGGGEGASYGAAQYQYNYLYHDEKAAKLKAESDLEACKAKQDTCDTARMSQLQGDIDRLNALDVLRSAELVSTCNYGSPIICMRLMQHAYNAEMSYYAQRNKMSQADYIASLLAQGIDPKAMNDEYLEIVALRNTVSKGIDQRDAQEMQITLNGLGIGSAVGLGTATLYVAPGAISAAVACARSSVCFSEMGLMVADAAFGDAIGGASYGIGLAAVSGKLILRKGDEIIGVIDQATGRSIQIIDDGMKALLSGLPSTSNSTAHTIVLSNDAPTSIVLRDVVDLETFKRLNVIDSDVGKIQPGEASAAAELESYLGGTLARAEGGSNADFVIQSGPYQGKTVDFMLTPNNARQAEMTNQFFENNLSRFAENLKQHIDAADIVPLDTRFLTEKNRSTLMDMIGGLSAAQKSKIVLMR